MGHAVPELAVALREGPERRSQNTCRHTFMLTLLYSSLEAGERKSLDDFSYVEIGTGFGNMIRMVREIYGFKSWAGIDLPLMTLLSEYYLGRDIASPLISLSISLSPSHSLYLFFTLSFSLFLSIFSLSKF